MFSAADAYERFMGRWSRRLAPLFVRFAGVEDADAVLDVGSGTGVLTAAVAEAARSGRVVGVEPSGPYAAYAAAHADRRITFETGSAQALPFPDHAFDRTLSSLVLNFIPDRAQAMSEMMRVTRRGGTVAAAVWDYGDGMQMLRTFWDEAVALNPAADRLDERHMPVSHAGELAALWQQHGLQDVVEQPLTIAMQFASFDDYWQPFLEGQGPAGNYAGSLSDGAREELRRRLHRRLLGDAASGPILLEGRAWAVRGRA